MDSWMCLETYKMLFLVLPFYLVNFLYYIHLWWSEQIQICRNQEAHPPKNQHLITFYETNFLKVLNFIIWYKWIDEEEDFQSHG